MRYLLIFLLLICEFKSFADKLNGPVFGEIIEVYYPKYQFGELTEGNPYLTYVNVYDQNNHIVYTLRTEGFRIGGLKPNNWEYYFYEYDKSGNLIKSSNDLGWTHNKYDQSNRLVESILLMHDGFGREKIGYISKYSYSEKTGTVTSYDENGTFRSKHQFNLDSLEKKETEYGYKFPDITNFRCSYSQDEDFNCRSLDKAERFKEAFNLNRAYLVFETRNVKKEGDKIISKDIYSIRKRTKEKAKISEKKFLELSYEYKYDNYNNLVYRLEKCHKNEGECGNRVSGPENCHFQRDDNTYYVLTKRTIISSEDDSTKKNKFIQEYILSYSDEYYFTEGEGLSWYKSFVEATNQKEIQLENEYLKKAQTLQSEKKYSEAIDVIEQHLSNPQFTKKEIILDIINECKENLGLEKIHEFEKDSLFEEALAFIENQNYKFKETHKEEIIRLSKLRDNKILDKVHILEKDSLFEDALVFIVNQNEKFKETHKKEIARISFLKEEDDERKILKKIESYEAKEDLYTANDLLDKELANSRFFQNEVGVLKNRIMKKIIENEQNKYSSGCVKMKNKNWQDALYDFRSIKYTHFDDLSKRIIKCEEKVTKQIGNR